MHFEREGERERPTAYKALGEGCQSTKLPAQFPQRFAAVALSMVTCSMAPSASWLRRKGGSCVQER